MTDQIAFIGVGNMGNPMADQLVKAGKKVKVYDVSPEVIQKVLMKAGYKPTIIEGKFDWTDRSKVDQIFESVTT